MPKILMTFEEFAAEHGDSIHINEGVLFEDGASSDGGFDHSPPPSSPEGLRALRILYLEKKIEFLEAQYDKLGRNIVSLSRDVQTQANFHEMGVGPLPDSEEVLAAFKDLKKRRDTLDEILEPLRKELAEIRPPNLKQPKLDQLSQHRQGASAFRDKLQKFFVDNFT